MMLSSFSCDAGVGAMIKDYPLIIVVVDVWWSR